MIAIELRRLIIGCHNTTGAAKKARKEQNSRATKGGKPSWCFPLQLSFRHQQPGKAATVVTKRRAVKCNNTASWLHSNRHSIMRFTISRPMKWVLGVGSATMAGAAYGYFSDSPLKKQTPPSPLVSQPVPNTTLLEVYQEGCPTCCATKVAATAVKDLLKAETTVDTAFLVSISVFR